MSELGEISAEVRAALASLDRALNRFSALDRGTLAPLEGQLAKSPQTRQAAALIARARSQLQAARNGAMAARRAGGDWLSAHGSGERGGSRESVAGGGARSPAAGDPASFSSGALEAVWAGGIETPAGRAYFTASEAGMRESAAALPPFGGEYTFDAHGRSDRVEFGETVLDAAGLAELIRADPRWEGRPVRLFSCNTGRGPNPIAAALARLLGVRVTAPDNLVWFGLGGEPVVAPAKFTVVNGDPFEGPDLEAKGAWRAFHP